MANKTLYHKDRKMPDSAYKSVKIRKAEKRADYRKQLSYLTLFERKIVALLDKHAQDVMMNFASRSEATNAVPYMEELKILFNEGGPI